MIFKKTLSAFLALGMLLGIVPVMAEEAIVTTEAPQDVVYYTDVFEGHATYLMEDPFSSANSQVPDDKGRPTGWDCEYRGGALTKSDAGLGFYDMSMTDPVSISKKILPHKDGKVTFETAFDMLFEVKSGFVIELLGEGGYAAKFITDDDKVCLVQPGDKKVEIGKYTLSKTFFLKAVLDMDTKKMEVYAQGKLVGTYAFTENCTVLEEVRFATPAEDTLDVNVKFSNLYINYLVNDRFQCSPTEVVPQPWTLESLGSGTTQVEKVNSTRTNDPNSFRVYDGFAIDNSIIRRAFDPQTKKVAAEVKFLAASGSENYVISLNSGKQKAIKLLGKGKNFYTTGNQVLYSNYYENLWYTLKVIADIEKQTADFYLNYKLIAENVPFENKVSNIDNFSVETGLRESAEILFDDVMIYEELPLPTDYVKEPTPVDSPDVHAGMLMYSMWREGTHYGWDRIAPYDDRKPYLGWYTEGSKEVADWETKWLVEHGFDYQVYPWARVNGNKNNPIKDTFRNHAFHDGYLSSEYSDKMKFALLYSYIYADNMGGMDDWKNNIVPYWIEYYFKDPRYMVVDNKPIIYNYTWTTMNSVFGGPEGIKEAINYLSEEVKKLGFDGVTVIGDVSNHPGEWAASGAEWTYTYASRNRASALDTMKSFISKQLADPGTKAVPSIPMGWDNEPWVTGTTGEFAEPKNVGELVRHAINEFDQIEASGRETSRNLMFTCWNEWGEGHFFCPSTAHGFDYLQEARNAMTNAGYNPNEEVPTDRALARIQVLYPPERSTLKILNEPATEPDPEDVYVLKGWYFDKEEDFNEWSIYKEIDYIKQENGALVGHSNNNDPRIANENIAIPLDNVAGIRSNIWVDGGSVGMFIYRTDSDPVYGQGKRFDANLTKSGYGEYFAGPLDATKCKGTMTGLFFDPDDALYENFGDFGVKYIEILAWKTPRINYYINGVLLNDICSPKVKEDGITYMSAYRTLQSAGADTLWVNKTKTFTIKKGDKTVILKDGSNIANINGVDTTMPGTAYYYDGHFMVPLHYICDLLGITVTNEKPVAEESAPFCYEFNVDNDKGKWATYNVAFSQVKDGSWLIKNATTDPMVHLTGLDIDADKYKYVKVRMKNLSGATTASIYFRNNGDSNWTGSKIVNVKASDSKEFVEYTFEMTSSSYWTGKVTGIRFDPTMNPGNIYIDYIRLSETP